MEAIAHVVNNAAHEDECQTEVQSLTLEEEIQLVGGGECVVNSI